MSQGLGWDTNYEPQRGDKRAFERRPDYAAEVDQCKLYAVCGVIVRTPLSFILILSVWQESGSCRAFRLASTELL